MKLDLLAAYTLNDIEPPKLRLADDVIRAVGALVTGPQEPVVDYAPLMAYNNTRQGSKHVPSFALDGVSEECQRVVSEHQQNRIILEMRRAGRPLSLSDHWLALTSSWRQIDMEAQLLTELSARRSGMADYLGINLHERHWPGHRAGTRPDFSALDRAFDVEFDHQTGKIVQIVHAGDLFHTGVPRR